MKKIRLLIYTLVATFLLSAQAYSQPIVHAQTHVLIEQESGRVLAENDMHRRMFPAATTMILTAILAYEFLEMDALYEVGSEITHLPHGSATIGLLQGDQITGQNLIRAMLIGTGLDSANVVAINVARVANDAPNMTWSEANSYFVGLMNQRAAELGTQNSRFMNPHGFHHTNHVSSAYDMAQIARHAMSIPAIAQIAAQPNFSGQMAGEGHEQTRRLNLTSPNELLRIYPYARGLRTGAHNLAGEVLVASAIRNGITLISVTMDSPIINYQPTRFTDNIALFEYAFENYAVHTLLTPGTIMGRLNVLDPRLGDYDYLEFYTNAEITHLLSLAELDRLQIRVDFLEDLVYYYNDEQKFIAPIGQNDMVGQISHALDGEVLFVSNLYAYRTVYARTTASDIDHYMGIFFSPSAVPYWVAGFLALVLLIIAYVTIKNRIRNMRARQSKYTFKGK